MGQIKKKSKRKKKYSIFPNICTDLVVILEFETAWRMPPKYKGVGRIQRITNIEMEVNMARAVAHARSLPIYRMIADPRTFNKISSQNVTDMKTIVSKCFINVNKPR